MPHRVETPARFERARCNLARTLYPLDRSAVKFVPRHHPWRVLVESAHDDLMLMTEEVLHPRNRRGVPERNPSLPPKGAERRTLLATPLLAGLAGCYLLLETTSRYVPGPVGDFTGWDESIRIFERLENLVGL